MSAPIPNEHLRISNEQLSCQPDLDSLFCHQLQSTAKEFGFQALLLFEKCDAKCKETIGLPEDFQSGGAYLQTCRPYGKFVRQVKAEPGCTITLTVENYLQLYAFFVIKWPLVLSQLTASSASMSSGTEWIRAGKNLKFLHHGQCVYSCNLGSDLRLAATAGSKKNGTDDYEIGLVIFRGDFEMELPLSTVTKLFSDSQAYHFIFEQYKKLQSKQSVVA